MTDPATTGLLDLRLAAGPGGITYVVERAQRFPLTMTVPLYLDPGDRGMAFVYVQNPTGGLFPGDRLVTKITADEGARVHLTTTSANKVFGMDDGSATQLEIVVADGAYVEYVPEQLIPYPGGRLDQTIDVTLGAGSTFVGTEIIAPGRFARGEQFQYDRLALTTTIRSRDGSELCVDTTLLEPERRRPERRGLLSSHPYAASLLLASPDLDPHALSEGLDMAAASNETVLAAAGALPNGVGATARVLAGSSIAAHSAVHALWTIARESILGRPPPARRK